MIELAIGLLLVGLVNIIYRRRPLTRIFLLLACSTITGLLNRLALYISGKSAPLDFVRFAVELSILLCTLQMLKQKPLPGPKMVRIVDWLVAANFLFSTLCALNIIFVSPGVTIGGWRWTCIPMLLYFLARRIQRPDQVINKFLYLLIGLLVMQSAYAIYQGTVGLPVFDEFWYASNPELTEGELTIQGGSFIAGRPRYPAMFTSYGQFTYVFAFMLLWIIFTPVNTCDLRRKKRLSILLAFVCLMVTAERVAAGMIVVGVATYFTINLLKRIGWTGVVLSLMTLLIIMISVARTVNVNSISWESDTVVKKRLLELANPLQASTVKWRLEEQWPLLFPLVAKNPFGYGLGSFQTTRLNQSGQGFSQFTSPHNMYLQTVLETGVIGLLLFLLLIFYYFWFILKASRKLKDRKFVARNSIVTLVPILVLGMVNPLQPPLTLFMWFSMGMTVSWVAELVKGNRRTGIIDNQLVDPIAEPNSNMPLASLQANHA